LINKTGDLVVRASNKINNRNFLNNLSNDVYVSALGLVYRKDFDNFSELLGFLLGKQRKEERNKENQKTLPPVSKAIKPRENERN